MDKDELKRQAGRLAHMNVNELQQFANSIRERCNWSTQGSEPVIQLSLKLFAETKYMSTFEAKVDIKPKSIIFSDTPTIVYPSYFMSSDKGYKFIDVRKGLLPNNWTCLACLKSIYGVIPYWCSKCGVPLCGESCESEEWHLPECEIVQKLQITSDPPRRYLDLGLIYMDIAVFRLLVQKFRDPAFSREIDLIGKHQRVQSYMKESKEYKEILATINHQTFTYSLALTGGHVPIISKAIAILNVMSHTFNERENICAFVPGLNFFSHGCFPNAEIDFYPNENWKVQVRASCAISKGERICVDFLQETLLPTVCRRELMFKRYAIDCLCKRCEDVTECDTYSGSIRCRSCKGGFMISTLPMRSREDTKSVWICNSGGCPSYCTYADIRDVENKVAEKISDLASITGSEFPYEKCVKLIKFFETTHIHGSHYLMLEFLTNLYSRMKTDPHANGVIYNTTSGVLLHANIINRLLDFSVRVLPPFHRILTQLQFGEVLAELRLREIKLNAEQLKLGFRTKNGHVNNFPIPASNTNSRSDIDLSKVQSKVMGRFQDVAPEEENVASGSGTPVRNIGMQVKPPNTPKSKSSTDLPVSDSKPEEERRGRRFSQMPRKSPAVHLLKLLPPAPAQVRSMPEIASVSSPAKDKWKSQREKATPPKRISRRNRRNPTKNVYAPIGSLRAEAECFHPRTNQQTTGTPYNTESLMANTAPPAEPNLHPGQHSQLKFDHTSPQSKQQSTLQAKSQYKPPPGSQFRPLHNLPHTIVSSPSWSGTALRSLPRPQVYAAENQMQYPYNFYPQAVAPILHPHQNVIYAPMDNLQRPAPVYRGYQTLPPLPLNHMFHGRRTPVNFTQNSAVANYYQARAILYQQYLQACAPVYHIAVPAYNY